MDIHEMIWRMRSQKLYFFDNEELMSEQLTYLDKVYDYNRLKPSMRVEKGRLLKEMFAEIGEECYIETPFYANWGGKHVHFGNRVYANFNLVLVDDGDIYVGDRVMIGPNVILCTATHPIEPELRGKQAQYNVPVRLEENVWIGANSAVLPGVTIGRNSVIGAGSLVNRDIPPDVVAVGNPCRVLRSIGEADRKYYYKNYEIDLS